MKPLYALALCALALPAVGQAASLTPLNSTVSLTEPLDPVTFGDPAIFDKSPDLPPAKREFVDGNVFQGNPMRGILPDNQWKAPKPAYAGPLLRNR